MTVKTNKAKLMIIKHFILQYKYIKQFQKKNSFEKWMWYKELM